jgi:serine protease Do
VLKQAMNLYFLNEGKIIRPSFGFSYNIVTQNESKLTGQNEGALIKDVSGLSAKQAGLLVGDIITVADGQAVNENSFLEEILQKYKPGNKMSLTVLRKNQTVNLTFTVGQLK